MSYCTRSGYYARRRESVLASRDKYTTAVVAVIGFALYATLMILAYVAMIRCL
jgi:hypothetical protein